MLALTLSLLEGVSMDPLTALAGLPVGAAIVVATMYQKLRDLEKLRAEDRRELEKQIDQLKGEQRELVAIAGELRESVAGLKEAVAGLKELVGSVAALRFQNIER